MRDALLKIASGLEQLGYYYEALKVDKIASDIDLKKDTVEKERSFTQGELEGMLIVMYRYLPVFMELQDKPNIPRGGLPQELTDEENVKLLKMVPELNKITSDLKEYILPRLDKWLMEHEDPAGWTKNVTEVHRDILDALRETKGRFRLGGGGQALINIRKCMIYKFFNNHPYDFRQYAESNGYDVNLSPEEVVNMVEQKSGENGLKVMIDFERVDDRIIMECLTEVGYGQWVESFKQSAIEGISLKKVIGQVRFAADNLRKAETLQEKIIAIDIVMNLQHYGGYFTNYLNVGGKFLDKLHGKRESYGSSKNPIVKRGEEIMAKSMKVRLVDLANTIEAYRRHYFKRKRMLDKDRIPGYKLKKYRGTDTEAWHVEDGDMPIDSQD